MVAAANADEIDGTFTLKHYASGTFVTGSGGSSDGTRCFANPAGDMPVKAWLDVTRTSATGR